MNPQLRAVPDQFKKRKIQSEGRAEPAKSIRVIPDIVARVLMQESGKIASVLLYPPGNGGQGKCAEVNFDHAGGVRPHGALMKA